MGWWICEACGCSLEGSQAIFADDEAAYHPQCFPGDSDAVGSAEVPSRSTKDAALAVGDSVRRVGGTYPFPGKIVSIFTKLDGTEMLVVESTSPDTKGMLHIYSPKQFARATLTDTANG